MTTNERKKQHKRGSPPTISQLPPSALKPKTTSQEPMPLAKAMETLMPNAGTELELPKFKIDFPKDKHSASPITELEVEITSVETDDNRLLYRIYSQTIEKTQIELKQAQEAEKTAPAHNSN